MTAASRRAKILGSRLPRLAASPGRGKAIDMNRHGAKYLNPGGRHPTAVVALSKEKGAEIPVIIPAGGRAPLREDALCR
jgi:hypothetical protein